jgi:hypothetical protein
MVALPLIICFAKTVLARHATSPNGLFFYALNDIPKSSQVPRTWNGPDPYVTVNWRRQRFDTLADLAGFGEIVAHETNEFPEKF